jgi:hypothetical protein
MKTKVNFIIPIIIALALVGEIICVYKFVTSDFKPSYKREAIYGISFITGFGAITGWFDIEDDNQKQN